MAQVDITINERTYQIACDDGQEEHLRQLGEYVDKRVKELIDAVGRVGDSRLLVMASLLIADELSETYANLKTASANGGQSVDAEELEAKLSGAFDDAAAQIEAVTRTLEY